MTLEIHEEGEMPPPKQTGRRQRRSANTEPDPVVTLAEDGSNTAVSKTLEDLGGDLEPVSSPTQQHPAPQHPQPVTVKPSDFAQDNTFAADAEDVGVADPSALNPFTRQPMEQPPTRKEVREDRKEERQAIPQTPSTKRFGAMGKKLPGSEHIQVYKRTSDGKLSLVGEYDTMDLTQSQNVQSFLYRYVRPQYGYGEYHIFGVDSQGRSFDAGSVDLQAPIGEAPPPAPATPPTDPLVILQKMMDNESQRRSSEMQAILQNQKDPFDMLAKLYSLQQQMMPPVPSPVIKSSPSGGDPQNTMTVMLGGVMQMMTTVMAQAMQPKSDPMAPILLALISKLAEKPEAPDPTQQLVALSEVAKNMRSGDGGGGNNQMIDLLLKERMSPTDVLGLVNQLRSERGTDDLKKSLENVGMLFNAVQQVRAHTEPSAGGGFMDVIASAINNPALTDALLSRTRGGGTPQAAPAPQAPRALPANDPLAQKARELAARKLRLEELEIARRERALAAGSEPPQPIPVASTVNESVNPPAPPPAPSEAAPPAAPSAAPVEASLPPNIASHINSYLEAKDDSDIIKITFNMIFDMSLDPRWVHYSSIILALVEQSDRGRFLHYMASLFSSLKSIQLVPDDLARRIMDSLQRNFETLVQFTRDSIKSLKAQQQGAGEGDAGEEDAEDDESGEGEEGDEGDEGDEDVLGLE